MNTASRAAKGGDRAASKIHKVIFRHLDEAPARRFYKRTPPAPGYIIALWRPDGTLIACTNGLARPAS